MAYFRCGGGGIPSSIKTDMNAVFNKKFGTQGETYPPTEWADDVNLMGVLPVRTATGTIAHFEDGADDVPMKSVVANIVPYQEGTGDPSPTNVRPISGTSVLNVTKCGVNLWDEEWELGTINLATGEEISRNDQIRSKNFIPIVPNLNYYTISPQGLWAVFYDKNKEIVTTDLPSATASDYGRLLSNRSWKAPNTAFYTRFYLVYAYGTTYNNDISINYPSTDTDYHAYTGSTYTFDLGQEIMGGSADVIGGSGEVTRVVVTYDGTEDWHSEGTNNFYVNSGRGSGVYYGEDKLLCSHFKSTYSSLGHNNNVYISATGNLNLQCDDITHTADGIKTWCATQYANGTPLQICYELKTSTAFTFTGQPINSYLGVNNLYTDSGEVLDVEYRADMNLLIAELEG